MKSKDIDAFFNRFRTLPVYVVEVGILGGYKNERKTKTEKKGLPTPEKKSKKREGVTNAEILFIQENGSVPRHIPPRPVLKMTIDHAKKDLVIPAVKRGLTIFAKTGNAADYDKQIKTLANQMQTYARELIKSNDGRLTPNAASTIRKKGENYPLHDTGQLERSIIARERKIEKTSED